MSVNDINTFVLLFPNEEWSNTATNTVLNSVVAQLRPNISFAQQVNDGLQTLSTHNADEDGAISGFLYVPDLDRTDDCYNISKEYIPANVTRQANLPPTDFTLVAIAPWINAECTLAYMDAAHLDPCRAFLFYLPNNLTTPPPPPSSPIWDLQDGGHWKTQYQFPIYVVPGIVGVQLMHQLALYSGNMTNVPFGHQISELPGIDPRDYVRLYTELALSNVSSLPSLWVFLVIVLAILVLMLGITSALMHLIQRSRRKSLRRRVASGEVNLEALGIKRLTVPRPFIERLPLFTYSSEGKTPPASPKHKKNLTKTTIEENDMQGGSSSSPQRIHQMQDELSISMEPPTSQIIILDDSTSNPDSVLVHKFLPYSQPTCAICLDDFQSGVTEIRELPCGHIFHPDCIDTFLANNSSLCPMCKKSALPIGYCPITITNAMVRRERNLRRLRSRVTYHDEEGTMQVGSTRGRLQNLRSIIKRSVLSSATTAPSSTSYTMPLQPQRVFMTNAMPAHSRGLDEGVNLNSETNRQEVVEQRIRELAAAQVLIRDPDVINERQQPQWRKTLSKMFPGFS